MVDVSARAAAVPPVPQQPTLPLRLQIKEDWLTHGRCWSKPGLHALIVQRVGAWTAHGYHHGPRVFSPVLRLLFVLYRIAFVFVRNFYGIEIFHDTMIGRRVRISHQHGITIHRRAEIGDDCIVHQSVTIGGGGMGGSRGAPKIGNRVQFGPGAAVLGRVTVGDDARIGPNAIVMSDVPPGSHVVATPARILGLGRPEIDLSTAEPSDSANQAVR